MTTESLTVHARTFSCHATWLAARKAQRRYGGTTVPAVLGMSQYRTPYEQWAEWRGDLEPQEQTDAMTAGLMMEPSILAWYAAKYGVELDGLPGPCAVDHPTDELASCSPDAMVVSERQEFPSLSHLVAGEVLQVRHVIGGADAKNLSSLYWRDKLNADGSPMWGPTDDDNPTDDVPRVYWVQCQWSCYCTGAPWWDLVVLWDGRDLVRYRIHADTEVQAALAAGVRDYHDRYVVADVAPPIDVRQGKRAKDSLLSLFSETTSAQVTATAADVAALVRYHQCKALEKRAKAVAETLQVRMINRLGNAGQLVLAGHDDVLNGDTGKPNKAKANRMMLATLKAGAPYKPGPSWEKVARAACEELASGMLGDTHPKTADELLAEFCAEHTPLPGKAKRKLTMRHGRTAKSMGGMLAEAIQVLRLETDEDPQTVAAQVLHEGVIDPRGADVLDVELLLSDYEPAKPPERDPNEPLPDEAEAAPTSTDTGTPTA